MKNGRTAAAVLAMVLVLSAGGRGQERVEAVFFNARVHTLDSRQPVAGAVATGGGRIIAVGGDDEILALASDGTDMFDMKGATLIPGLVDAHAHFSGYALSREWIDLVGTSSLEEVLESVLQKAAMTGKGKWITGRGWDQNDWVDATLPRKEDLDKICPDNPVYLVRVCGHAAVANSAALRLARIGDSTPDPEGGRIVRDASGEVTGILIDEAKELVSEVVPQPSREDKKRLFVEAAHACLEKGLTGIHDMGIGSETASIYRELYDEEMLPVRLTVYYSHEVEDIDSLLNEGVVRGFAGGYYEAVGVKFYMDGSLGARSAALLEDYSDDPGNDGLIVTEPEEMLSQIIRCSRKGFQVSIHAIGDRGNRTALDVLEKAMSRSGGSGVSHRIEHAQILHPDDIDRFSGLGVIPSMQFTHCTSDMPWAGDRLGQSRLAGAYAWRSLLSTGCRIPGGSDFPVESIDPFLGIYAAVTRMDREGNPPGGWYPDQCLTIREAVKAFTLDAAWAAGQDEDRGTISKGKLADFTVISGDIMSASGEEILDIGVYMTVVGGKVFYRDPGFTTE